MVTRQLLAIETGSDIYKEWKDVLTVFAEFRDGFTVFSEIIWRFYGFGTSLLSPS